jgi:signal peptidase II
MNKIKEITKKIFFSYIWLAVLFILIDQITKWIVQTSITTNDVIRVIPGLCNIILSHNEGAAFGLGDTGDVTGRIIFICISLVVGTALLIYYFKKFKTMKTSLKVVFSLLIAGCFGNLIDRAFYWQATVGFNGVIDWIDFYLGTSHFATFNIADSCLTIGTIVFIIIMVKDEMKAKKSEGAYDLSPEELEKKKIAQNENKDVVNIDSSIVDKKSESKDE